MSLSNPFLRLKSKLPSTVQASLSPRFFALLAATLALQSLNMQPIWAQKFDPAKDQAQLQANDNKPNAKKSEGAAASSAAAKGDAGSAAVSDKENTAEEDTGKKEALKESSASENTASESTLKEDPLEALERAQKEEDQAKAMLNNEALDHYQAAQTYMRNFEFDLAQVELKAAINCIPTLKAAHRDFALVSLCRGDFGRAVSELLIVVGIGEPVPFSENQQEAIKDEAMKQHYRAGLKLAADSKWKDALIEFEWALFYRPESGKVLRSIAFAHASEGHFDEAEKFYSQSFSQDPEDAYGHADFAFLLAAKGSAEKAVEQLSEAVKLQPKVVALHVDLGWMAESKSDLVKAESEFQEAVKLAPKQASLWTHLGKIQARRGDAEQAAKSFEQALALDASQMEAQSGLAGVKPVQAEPAAVPASGQVSGVGKAKP
ncbi:MAG: tetratricopeptide repeat protein [Candidatus Obscuribacter phosphatis]|uniref:Tetratricopeptide repeat protein n=1 Tax=Candidatus Obscuribacter phosphatis TaxID=1906157 RepID=A0A8J7TNI5_9BACT|nr:tetratricopeptide repeat protein [Candidatus Obscuribacter phosphatis]